MRHHIAARHVRDARIKAKLTQEAAGALIGAARRTWQDWETGRRNMPMAKYQLFTLLLLREQIASLGSP